MFNIGGSIIVYWAIAAINGSEVNQKEIVVLAKVLLYVK